MANIMSVLLELVKPSGLWPKLFDWFASFATNYGWTIVLFTIAVKLLVSPLDFYNRYSTRKNTLIQKRLSGQVQKINLKYQNNKEEANRQVASLYKKEGYNMIGSCVFMLLNMVITLVVFFSFFNSLRAISCYKMLDQYTILEQTYNQTEGTVEEKEAKTLEKYLEYEDKNSWLWVKNIWRNDAKVSSIPSLADLKKVAKSSGNKSYKEFVTTIDETEYNAVINSLKSKESNWNGYYILAIIVTLTTFLSQFLSEKMNNSKTKQQNNEDPTQKTMQIMKIVMPLIMLIFVLTNTASFGIYILVGNIFSILINILFNFFVKKLTQNEEEKYLAYIEKEAIHNKKQQQKPHMVTYKKLGDRLWTQLK